MTAAADELETPVSAPAAAAVPVGAALAAVGLVFDELKPLAVFFNCHFTNSTVKNFLSLSKYCECSSTSLCPAPLEIYVNNIFNI